MYIYVYIETTSWVARHIYQVMELSGLGSAWYESVPVGVISAAPFHQPEVEAVLGIKTVEVDRLNVRGGRAGPVNNAT